MADHPELRASDADRERVVGELRRHLTDGRLDLAEFEERAGQAYAARTIGDLTPLLADLPRLRATSGGPPVRAGSPEARVRRGRAVARPGDRKDWPPELASYFRFWVALAVMFVVIWALAGGGYFWPVWPMFGTGVPMLFMIAIRK
jgi:hypothetical protein